MQKLKQNLKGFYLAIRKDNFNFQISKKNLDEKINNFPTWMENQINSEFKNCEFKNCEFKNCEFTNSENIKNEIDQTIQNLKDQNLLKEAEIVKVKIKNNKIRYKNFLHLKLHPRFVRFQNFMQKSKKFIKFPDTVFLYSIADSIDNPKLLECLKAPVFCISKKQSNNKVILFPHIEWMEKNDLLLDSISKAAVHLNWDQKKPQAFWRGATTGYLELAKNERLKVVKLASHYPHLIDASFSNISQITEENKNYLLKNFELKEKSSPIDQIQYKYLLSIDGNAFSGSFFWQLFSNSVILKNKSDYLEWYYSGVKSDKHYLEFDSDKDLIAKLHWLKDNDKKAKKISENANIFANENLKNEDTLAYIFKLLTKHSEIIKNN
ncbi:MAG: hypothetical protein K1060chlam1_01185 [Candidatus Anoxychlamydiales bacterium]|nr:hypothetical protein [Candidatus Anoxychlamydiales bacterium]